VGFFILQKNATEFCIFNNLPYLCLLNKTKNMKVMKFINNWYPIILAFICMLYSIGLGLAGHTAEAQYSAHWPGTILLFALAIRQRRKS
jgi:hypothetical protein